MAARGAQGAGPSTDAGPSLAEPRLLCPTARCVADNVWSYDFAHRRTHDGRAFRTLDVLNELTRESLVIRVRRHSPTDVTEVPDELPLLSGIPSYLLSNSGPELVSVAVRQWIACVCACTAFIKLGSPWENGYIESLNARLRDELLNGEIS